MEPIQRIMIGAEVVRQAAPANRSLEHPAQRCPVDNAALDTEADDARAKLVHHDQNAMSSQARGTARRQASTQTRGAFLEDEDSFWTSSNVPGSRAWLSQRWWTSSSPPAGSARRCREPRI